MTNNFSNFLNGHNFHVFIPAHGEIIVFVPHINQTPHTHSLAPHPTVNIFREAILPPSQPEALDTRTITPITPPVSPSTGEINPEVDGEGQINPGSEKQLEKNAHDLADKISKDLIPEQFIALLSNLIIPRLNSPIKINTISEKNVEELDPQEKVPVHKEGVAKGESKIEEEVIPEEIDPIIRLFEGQKHTTADKLTKAPPNTQTSTPPRELNMKEKLQPKDQKLPSFALSPSPFSMAGKSSEIKFDNSLKVPIFVEKKEKISGEVSDNEIKKNKSLPKIDKSKSEIFITDKMIVREQLVQPAQDIVALPDIPETKERQYSSNKAAEKNVDDRVARSAHKKAIHAKKIDSKQVDDNQNVIPQKLEKIVLDRFPLFPEFLQARRSAISQERSVQTEVHASIGFRLEDLVLMVLSAVISGATNTDQIVDYLFKKELFFSTWLGLKHGLPTPKLLSTFLHRITPIAIKHIIEQSIKSSNASPIRNILIWESLFGFIVGELKTGMPLKQPLYPIACLFDLYQAVITVQSSELISEISQVTERGAHYVVELLHKHGLPYDEAECFFEITLKNNTKILSQTHKDVIENGNRIESREIVMVDNIAWLSMHPEWLALKTALECNSEVFARNQLFLKRGFYLSSLPLDASMASAMLRWHNALEKNADWIMDFDFMNGGVDNSLKNLEFLTHMGISFLEQETSLSVSLEDKILKAAEDNSYLLKVIKAGSL